MKILWLLTAALFALPTFADEALPLHGFADVSLGYDKASEKSNFELGGLDLFLSNKIDKKTNFLVELVFENNEAGELRTDLERAFITYTVSPLLKVSAGRFHTALGYWNETYHHGGYLYTSVRKPLLIRFEDDNGILPLHIIGLELAGNTTIAEGNFGYKFDLGNGRGPKSDPPQTTSDADKTKSASLLLYYEMTNGIRFGATVYKDRMPGGVVKTQAPDPLNGNVITETSTVVNPGNELILGAHLVYNSPTIEFLSEYFNINHKYMGPVESEVTIKAWYAQLGLHFGLYTPFIRYEINDTDKPDSYTELAAKRVAQTGGVRYEVSENSALKLEVEDITQSSVNTSTGKLNWSYSW